MTLSAYNYDTFASLKASTATGTTPKIMRLWGYYSAGDGGHATWIFQPKSTAAPDEAYVVKPSNIALSAPGRYHRLHTGEVSALSLGLRANRHKWQEPAEAFDNAPLLARAIAGAEGAGVHTIYFPPCSPDYSYHFKSAIELDKRLRLAGAPSAVWQPPTVLTFAGSDGIRLTGGLTYQGEAAPDWTFNEAVIEHLSIRHHQTKTYPDRSSFVGVFANTHFRMNNIAVQGFGGYAYRIHGNAADRPQSTNLNCSRAAMLFAAFCGGGLYISGGDVNVTVIDQLNVNSVREWGLLDESLLGVVLIAPHFANCGIYGTDEATYPSGRTYIEKDGLNHYFIARKDSLGAPPVVGVSDEHYTYLWSDKEVKGDNNHYGLHTPWAAGKEIRGCGAFKTTRAVNTTAILGGYTEENQGHSHVVGSTAVWGGFMGTPVYGRYGEVGIGGSEYGACVKGDLFTAALQLPGGGGLRDQSRWGFIELDAGSGDLVLKGRSVSAGGTRLSP
jgi:hypothetical protein